MSTRPAFIRPLIPSVIAKSPPKGGAWGHGVKLDGYRAQISKGGDRVRIFTRSGAECTERLPRMVEAFAKLPTISAVLDGELCFVRPDGRANFYALMREMRTGSPDEWQSFPSLTKEAPDPRGPTWAPVSCNSRAASRLSP